MQMNGSTRQVCCCVQFLLVVCHDFGLTTPVVLHMGVWCCHLSTILLSFLSQKNMLYVQYHFLCNISCIYLFSEHPALSAFILIYTLSMLRRVRVYSLYIYIYIYAIHVERDDYLIDVHVCTHLLWFRYIDFVHLLYHYTFIHTLSIIVTVHVQCVHCYYTEWNSRDEEKKWSLRRARWISPPYT